MRSQGVPGPASDTARKEWRRLRRQAPQRPPPLAVRMRTPYPSRCRTSAREARVRALPRRSASSRAKRTCSSTMYSASLVGSSAARMAARVEARSVSSRVATRARWLCSRSRSMSKRREGTRCMAERGIGQGRVPARLGAALVRRGRSSE